MPIDEAKLARLQAASAANRTGGKGTPRRKVAAKPKGAAGEDKKLQAALKKLNVQPVSGIDEVNMFKEDGNVLHFKQPKVHGAGSSNTYAVYGNGVDKELTELVPGILSQLGPDSLASLRKLAESYQAMNAAHMASQGGAAGAGAGGDDEVPDVPTNFDEAGEKKDGDAAAAGGEAEVEKLD